MSNDLDLVEGAVVFSTAMVLALSNGAADGFVSACGVLAGFVCLVHFNSSFRINVLSKENDPCFR